MLTLLLILLPIVAGVITLAVGANLAKQVALISALAVLGLTLFVWSQFDPSAGVQFAFKYNWLTSAGISFAGGLDGISLLLVLLTTFLTPLIVLSTFGHTYKNSATFYALMLFMEAALIGVFTATDAFLFYLFFEAALIPVYFLAAVWGGENRLKVTFKFFIYTLFGSLFMLVAFICITRHQAHILPRSPHFIICSCPPNRRASYSGHFLSLLPLRCLCSLSIPGSLIPTRKHQHRLRCYFPGSC
jgi:NADH-quinone oxidoreductase subunit M